MPERKLISEADVRSAAREGRTQLHAGEKTIITPLARDALRELGVELVRRPRGSAAGPRAPRDTVPATIAGTSASGVSTTKFNSSGRAASRVRTTAMPGSQQPKSAQPDGCECGTNTAATGVIAIGSDHGGFEMKADLKKTVESLGWAIDDVGTHSGESCDYPDFAYAVARTVSTGGADLGIMIDGAGPGSAIACNKVPGIRAACVHDEFTAWNARAHNDANVITLGSRGIGAEVARRIVRVYLETAFEGGRHARRVEKLSDIEARFVEEGEGEGKAGSFAREQKSSSSSSPSSNPPLFTKSLPVGAATVSPPRYFGHLRHLCRFTEEIDMANAKYDVVVIGTGPGGYETAIRATQLGFKTAVVERDKLGGVCLNIGCIPTKALLKSAEVMEEAKHISDFGLLLEGDVKADFAKVVERSRGVADKMNKGVTFLMKKNKIDVLYGHGRLTGKGKIDVEPSTNMDGEEIGEKKTVEAKHIIIATGARAREIPPLPVDGEKIITYREAMLQKTPPKRMVVCGAGAIGVEFAYFYNQMGTEVTIVELLDRLVPVEDEDVSKELAKAFKKQGITTLTSAEVQSVDQDGEAVTVKIKTKKGEETIECDQVLSAVGVVGNIEDVGLDAAGVKAEKGQIEVDEFYRTNVDGIYAIGDVAGPPWLAHKASHEGILCVEKIAGEDVRPIDYNNIPGCTYCQPQIASVGYTEEAAKEAGYEVKVGKFPFSASGKASALGHNEGFVKVVYDAQYGEWLGCHIIGRDATELIAEAVTARTLETTVHEVIESMHPHPTLSEAVMEASRDAVGESINI